MLDAAPDADDDGEGVVEPPPALAELGDLPALERFELRGYSLRDAETDSGGSQVMRGDMRRQDGTFAVCIVCGNRRWAIQSPVRAICSRSHLHGSRLGLPPACEGLRAWNCTVA